MRIITVQTTEKNFRGNRVLFSFERPLDHRFYDDHSGLGQVRSGGFRQRRRADYIIIIMGLSFLISTKRRFGFFPGTIILLSLAVGLPSPQGPRDIVVTYLLFTRSVRTRIIADRHRYRFVKIVVL